MKNPYLTLALLSAVTFSSCGDDADKQPNTDSGITVDVPTPQPDKKEPATTKYAGSYSFGTNPEKEATGTLMVYPLTDTMALVHLDIQKGAPSYNSGSLTQSVAILADTGMIWIGNNDDGECKIALHFNGNDVTVQTHAYKGCGFGANVLPDHVYTRENNEVPQYYFTGEGDTVWFKTHMEKGLSMPAH